MVVTTRAQTTAKFVKDVMEVPLVTELITNALYGTPTWADDIIAFSSVSKDSRFMEAIKPDLRYARFHRKMTAFFAHWTENQNHYLEMMESVEDQWIQDNIIYERDAWCTLKMTELCEYLRENWILLESAPKMKDAVYRKVTEMIELLPDFRETGCVFIDEMF